MRDPFGGIVFAKFNDLTEVAMFEDILVHFKKSEPYTKSKSSAFRLMRDGFMRGPSKRLVSSNSLFSSSLQTNTPSLLLYMMLDSSYIKGRIIYKIKEGGSIVLDFYMFANLLLFIAPVIHFVILIWFSFQDKSTKPWTEKFKNDDGIELMIPA